MTCPFCGATEMESIYGDPQPRMVWQCPLGCGLERPLCKNCFPQVHHQPSDEALVRWDADHLSDGCHAPEALLAFASQVTGQGRFALRATYKDLRRYAGLVASELYQPGPEEPGYDLSLRLRAAARGQRVHAAHWRRALMLLPELPDSPEADARDGEALGGGPTINDAPALSCALAAAAVQIVTLAKVHDAPTRASWRGSARGHQYVQVVEAAAQAAGVAEMHLAELQVRVEISRWARGERVPRDVEDAAVAAVLVGKEQFAQKLVENYANDVRKRKSADI